MMITVYKYAFPLRDRFSFRLPVGAEILHVAEQNGEPHMWARVDHDAPMEVRRFEIVGTGRTAPGYEHRHVATFFTGGGAGVWHLFEVAPP